jgi:hypothetical protein
MQVVSGDGCGRGKRKEKEGKGRWRGSEVKRREGKMER